MKNMIRSIRKAKHKSINNIIQVSTIYSSTHTAKKKNSILTDNLFMSFNTTSIFKILVLVHFDLCIFKIYILVLIKRVVNKLCRFTKFS